MVNCLEEIRSFFKATNVINYDLKINDLNQRRLKMQKIMVLKERCYSMIQIDLRLKKLQIEFIQMVNFCHQMELREEPCFYEMETL